MIFKKHVSIALIFFILVSNFGVAFNVHYCQGKLASISSNLNKESIIAQKKEGQFCCAMTKPSHKKCCSDKKIELKNKTEKTTIKTIAFNFDSVFHVNQIKSVDFVAAPSVISLQVNDFCCDANAPPLYLLYSQFTFYA